MARCNAAGDGSKPEPRNCRMKFASLAMCSHLLSFIFDSSESEFNKETYLHSWLTGETAGALMPCYTGLRKLPRNMEAFLNSRMTAQSVRTWLCCMATHAVLGWGCTFLDSRLARVGRMTLAENRAVITRQTVPVPMATRKEPESVTTDLIA